MAEEMERFIHMKRYLPEFLQEIREFHEITAAEDREVSLWYETCGQLWNDGFIRDASLTGVKRWESLLGIKTWPGDTLEDRKNAVLSRWNRQPPNTWIRLEEQTKAVAGENGYELYLRNDAYQLELILIDQSFRTLQSMRASTKEMIPANLEFIFVGKYPVDVGFSLRAENELRLISDFYARNNRKFLFLDGTWGLDGHYRVNGFREENDMEFYPAELRLMTDVCLPSGESMKCKSLLTVEKDLWFLDGTEQLDGERILDAEVFEYEC